MAQSERRGLPDAADEIVRRFDVLTVAAIVLLLLTIVLIGIVMSLPWWAFFTNGTMSAWYLGTMCENGTCTSYAADPALRDTFGLTSGLVAWSVVLIVLALAAYVVSILWPRIGVVSFVLGILGSILLLVAPIYLDLALPGALSASGFRTPVDGFFGSYTQPGLFGTTQYSWTGAAGWFAAWGVVVFSFVATALAYATTRRRLRETSGARMASRGSVRRSPGVARERFCPLCGLRYPPGARFCTEDATPLKDAA